MRRLAALAALAAGVACTASAHPGRSLPRAGSAGDDGTGVVARMSRGQHPHPDGSGDEGDDATTAEEEPFGGEEYGGGAYGGAVYGVGGLVYPAAGTAPSPTAAGYLVDNVVESGRGGSIEGTVVWRGGRAPATLPATTPAAPCGATLPNPTLRVSGAGGLRDAVVFLADVKSGKAAPPSQGGTLELGACRFAPYVQLAEPIGQVLAVTNLEESPAAVRLTRRDTGAVPGRGEAVVDLALGARGESTLLLDREAVYEATSPGGHPAASAWIVVPPHPYYALTDAEGHFRLDEVPPGEYTLVVWHPPVVTGMDARGVPVRSPAAESRTHVRVEERRTVTTRLELR